MSQDLAQAISLLRTYSCMTPKQVNSLEEKKQLRGAIQLLVSLADEENLGICASNTKQALDTLSSYLHHLGYEFSAPQATSTDDNSVYLKFSTGRMAYHIHRYDGHDHGVLLTIFSQQKEQIVGTYGYFPTDLFEDQ